LTALYAVLQHFTGWHWLLPQPPEPLGNHFRSMGFFSVLLLSSLYFVLAGMACLNLGWWKRKTATGKLFLAIAALSYLALLFNAGRAGLLAFGTGLALFLLLNFSRKKFFALGGVLGLTLAAYVVNPAIFTRFEQFKGYEFEQTAENRRLAVWQRSYEIFQDHPVFGVGPDNFKTAYAEKIKGRPAKLLGHAHNDFLNVLVYSGFFGLSAFIFFWKQIAIRLWRGFKENRDSPELLMALCILAAYLVYAQFESSLVYRETRMVLFLLLGAAISVLEEKAA
jgi:O-antigen ligase